jgi:hypothetical protein
MKTVRRPRLSLLAAGRPPCQHSHYFERIVARERLITNFQNLNLKILILYETLVRGRDAT